MVKEPDSSNEYLLIRWCNLRFCEILLCSSTYQLFLELVRTHSCFSYLELVRIWRYQKEKRGKQMRQVLQCSQNKDFTALMRLVWKKDVLFHTEHPGTEIQFWMKVCARLALQLTHDWGRVVSILLPWQISLTLFWKKREGTAN